MNKYAGGEQRQSQIIFKIIHVLYVSPFPVLGLSKFCNSTRYHRCAEIGLVGEGPEPGFPLFSG